MKRSIKMSFSKELFVESMKNFKVTPDMDVQQASDKIANAVQCIKNTQGIPKVVIQYSLRLSQDGARIEAIEFLVKLSKMERSMDIKKRKFNVMLTDHTIESMVEEFSNWFASVTEYIELVQECKALNDEVDAIAAENDVEFYVHFEPSKNKVVEISDKGITVGVSDEVARKIPKLSLFEAPWDEVKANYREVIANTLKMCQRPFDILRVKTGFTKDMDTVSRVGICKVLRKTYTKQAKNTRNGIGYIDSDGIFAIVERFFVSNAEAEELKAERGEPVHVEEQKSKSSKLADKEKVVTYYTLSPFNKETLEPEELVIQFD